MGKNACRVKKNQRPSWYVLGCFSLNKTPEISITGTILGTSLCGPLPPCAYLRVPPNGGKPTKYSNISIENSASVWIFGNLLTNSQLKLRSVGMRNFSHGSK